MVILVEDVEERLDFRGAELKGGEGHGLVKLTRGGKVAIHNFAKAQHGRTEQVIMRIPQGLKPVDCRALNVGAKAPTPKPEHSGLKAGATTRSTRECSAPRQPREAGVWRAAPGFGKMLGGNSNDGKEHTMSLAVGHTAPDFTLKDQNQKEVKLSDFAGKKKVVLVFYPLDWSPTCTNEHACFVNEMKQFETLDAEVLGVSVDSVWSHKAYAEKMGIKYSLLADFHPKGATGEKYGVYLGEKGITGRAIFIVDKHGKVAWAKNYDIPVVPDVKEVATALGGVK